ncbi:MAG: hypothetical protein WCA35_09400, partial [Kovacikia sp.]
FASHKWVSIHQWRLDLFLPMLSKQWPENLYARILPSVALRLRGFNMPFKGGQLEVRKRLNHGLE